MILINILDLLIKLVILIQKSKGVSMKLKKLAIATMLFTTTSVFAAEPVKKELTVKEESYAIGMKLGEHITKNINMFEENGLEFDLEMIIEGIRSKILDTPNMSEEQMIAAINSVNAKIKLKRSQAGSKKMAENAKILEEISKKEGVIKTPSGLMYEVLKKGDGKKPTIKNKVKVHYRGFLLNGEEFDSSLKRDKPFEFNVSGGVIKGWLEAIKLMSVGSKYKLTIPPELAYGSRGAGAAIPPNAILQFEVELLEIK